MHKLLGKKKKYQKETYQDMRNRYSGYGEAFFEELRTVHPVVFKNFEFYKELNTKYNDVIAIYDKEIAFVVTLDSYCETIFMSNKKSKICFVNQIKRQ